MHVLFLWSLFMVHVPSNKSCFLLVRFVLILAIPTFLADFAIFLLFFSLSLSGLLV